MKRILFFIAIISHNLIAMQRDYSAAIITIENEYEEPVSLQQINPVPKDSVIIPSYMKKSIVLPLEPKLFTFDLNFLPTKNPKRSLYQSITNPGYLLHIDYQIDYLKTSLESKLYTNEKYNRNTSYDSTINEIYVLLKIRADKMASIAISKDPQPLSPLLSLKEYSLDEIVRQIKSRDLTLKEIKEKYILPVELIKELENKLGY